jgi:hypothetical protein
MNPALPPDLPDEPVDAKLTFTTRRKAELLPPIRSAVESNGFEPKARGVRVIALDGWQSGFRWGVAAVVGGLALVAALVVSVLK